MSGYVVRGLLMSYLDQNLLAGLLKASFVFLNVKWPRSLSRRSCHMK